MLIFIGGKDPGNKGNAEARWTKARSAGAVVDQRMSPNGGSTRSVDATRGWLGNNQTGEVAPFATYPANKSDASWLSDEASARQWRAQIGAK